jgi:hypothetical protein
LHRKSCNLLDVGSSNHADADGIDCLQIGSYAALSIHVVIISLLNLLDKKDNLLLTVMMNKIYLKSLFIIVCKSTSYFSEDQLDD